MEILMVIAEILELVGILGFVTEMMEVALVLSLIVIVTTGAVLMTLGTGTLGSVKKFVKSGK